MIDAVAAGFEVVAIDAFADEDTKRLAHQIICVEQVNGSFDTADFLSKWQDIKLDECAGLLYGSGFEGNIELLTALEQQVTLIGNLPQTVAAVKNPAMFFAVLDRLDIPHPEVCFKDFDNKQGWLIKHAGGTGGLHIKKAHANTELEKGEYWQLEVATDTKKVTPISLLFLADFEFVEVVGFNQQLLAATETMPYRYGGVVSHYSVTEKVCERLCSIARELSKFYGLRGLNSIDVMLVSDGLDEQLLVLEINPRLSASIGLYCFENAHLLKLHVEVFMNKRANNKACDDVESLSGHYFKAIHLNSTNLEAKQNSIAHGIFYAPIAIFVEPEKAWPSWVADIPQSYAHIAKQAPVCTVMASGDDSESACQQLLIRLAVLEKACNCRC